MIINNNKYPVNVNEKNNMEAFKVINKNIYLSLSIKIRNIIKNIPAKKLSSIEEIRLRKLKTLMVHDALDDWFVSPNGDLHKDISCGYIVTEEDIEKTLELMSNNSIYAIQEELKNGYITIAGGHRVGLVGKAVIDNGKISMIKEISGINIRVSREIIGAADKVINHIITEDNGVNNTLIISPPQCGKTTMLRDIARQLSKGIERYNFNGIKVGIVDERSEIAASYKGVAQNNLGPRTDILDACPKAFGMMMFIRSMSPQVIITDEIGMEEDIEALKYVFNAGVKIITSVHGYNRKDIEMKPILGNLLKENIFDRLIVLSKRKGTGSIENIFNEKEGEFYDF